jgi:hypothetical protein
MVALLDAAMAHIFISYSRDDIDMARALARVLESEGLEVWWDPKIRVGQEFPRLIEEQIWQCHHVIVLWSRSSVYSKWVRREAGAAKELNKLLPVIIEDCQIPYGFRSLHSVKFGDWGSLMEQLYNVIGGGGLSMPSYAVHSPASPAREAESYQLPSTAPPRRPVMPYIIVAALVALGYWLIAAKPSAKPPQQNPTSDIRDH